MGITGIGHVYAETSDWEGSVAFWEGLGFSFADRWESDGHRAGRLECNSAAVVLAEVPEEPQHLSVFFDIERPEDAPDLPGVVTPLTDTHWGTRWIRVEDPDGRIHALEERS